MQMEINVFEAVQRDYPDYLRDESRSTGQAHCITFPRSQAELLQHLKYAAVRGLAITIQGARTGITGGAVPDGGQILNLTRLNSIGDVRERADGTASVTVEAGAILADVREVVRKAGWFLTPDPTEVSASIGGMIACNASGARSFYYGATRNYVDRLRIVLADGDVLELVRGERRADGRIFALTTQGGRDIVGTLPTYPLPAVKSAAGYFVEDDMDLVDLFIGAEGTLGIVAEADLKLIPVPGAIWGVQAFLPSEAAATEMVRGLKKLNDSSECAAQFVALEFADSRALDLLREQKENNPAFGQIPNLAPQWDTGVYVEIHGSSEADAEEAVMLMSELMVECGGDEDATWLASDERELERLKAFRHALPEAVNLVIDDRRKSEPTLTKLGTDLAVPDEHLEETLAMYHRDLDAAGLEHVVFGHIGDNHLHVNILPATLADYQRGKELYLKWARKVVENGGTVSAEHGIGKLKTSMLHEMFGDSGIAEMRVLKKVFDPDNRLNPGNLFPANRQ